MAPKRKSDRVTFTRPGLVKAVAEDLDDWINNGKGQGKLVCVIAGCFIRGPYIPHAIGMAATLYKTALQNKAVKDKAAREVFLIFVENKAENAQKLQDSLMELKEEYKESAKSVKYMIIDSDLVTALYWIIGDGFRFCESGKAIFTPLDLPIQRFIERDTPFLLLLDYDAVPEIQDDEHDLPNALRTEIFQVSTNAVIETAWFAHKPRHLSLVLDVGP